MGEMSAILARRCVTPEVDHRTYCYVILISIYPHFNQFYLQLITI